MSETAKLKNVLREQISGYRRLLGLLATEKECLVEMDGRRIVDLSKEKDTLVLRLRLLEEERIRLIRLGFGDLGRGGDPTLTAIYEQTGDEELKELRLRLVSVLQSIEEMNAFNNLLIQRSLSFIRSALGFIRPSASAAHPGGEPSTLLRKV